MFFSPSTFQKLSVTSSNGNSPQLINTTECNGSVNTACTTPEEPEELDARVTPASRPHTRVPAWKTGLWSLLWRLQSLTLRRRA